MKKCIKNLISFVMCIALTMSVFAGVVMRPENTMIVEAAANTSDNAKEVYRYLICNMGLNPAAACGVMANINAESGFRTGAIGDAGTSYGLCQWHLGRRDRLFTYCEENHLDVNSVEGQMRYLEWELKNGYPQTYEKVTTATNDEAGVRQAAYYWCKWFEVPADTENKANARADTAVSTYWPVYGTINGVNISVGTANFITDSSVMFAGTVYKPAEVTINSCGVYFGTDEASMVKYVNDQYAPKANVYGIGYDYYTSNGGGNPTLNIEIETGTMYYYQFYCTVGENEYRSERKSFIKLEYDLDFDYEQWYEKVHVGNNQNWSMPPVAIATNVAAINNASNVKWTSSDTSVATVTGGIVSVKNYGVTNVIANTGSCYAFCKVYAGRVFDPQIEFRSKTRGTKQNSFVLGDTVQISPVRQNAINCYYLELYRMDDGVAKCVATEFFSKESTDKSDWWLEETWEYVPENSGLYKAHMLFANNELNYRDFYFEVLDKSDEPVDISVADTTPADSGLGSLAGVSMTLDGYIIMNYYVLPTDDSIGTDMAMQFTVDGQVQVDNEYEIAVVGDKVAYKYECRLAATELTQNVTAKLILGDTVKELKTLSAYNYCKNVLEGAASNDAYYKASPLVKALLNYGGYAQLYFGDNTENIANAGLYTEADADPVSDSVFADIVNDGSRFAAYVNGTQLNVTSTSSISMNGIQYLGTSLTLDSGTGLNMYFALPENITENDLAGYTISIDGIGTIRFVAENNYAVPAATAEDAEVIEEAIDEDEVQADVAVTESGYAGAGDVLTLEEGQPDESQLEEEQIEETQSEELQIEEIQPEEDQIEDIQIAETSEVENADEESVISDYPDAEEIVAQAITVSAVIDNGTRIAYTMQGNILCVKILNIAADDLDNVYAVKMSASTGDELLINYSPVQYMIDMQGSNSNYGVRLMRAMYLYYKAVEAYKGRE